MENEKKRKPGFPLQVAGVVCLLVYIIIPVLKVTGIMTVDLFGENDSLIFNGLLLVAVVLYIAGRMKNAAQDEEEAAQEN